MSLSRKDYIGLAKVFNKAFQSSDHSTECILEVYICDSVEVELLHSLCEFLRNDNERFDETKFRNAVVLGESKWLMKKEF